MMTSADDVLSALEGQLRVGQRVRSSAGAVPGVVVYVDDSDTRYPYWVRFDDHVDPAWCRADEIAPVAQEDEDG